MKTPMEKWQELIDPKANEDDCVSMTESELRTFPDGRAFLCTMRKFHRKSKWMGKRMVAWIQHEKDA